MDMVSLTIDGIKVQVPAGTTVLEAARSANIQIPTLCYLKDVNQIGACRMCLVDTGARALAAACVMPVSDGMVVKTNTPAIREARRRSRLQHRHRARFRSEAGRGRLHQLRSVHHGLPRRRAA